MSCRWKRCIALLLLTFSATTAIAAEAPPIAAAADLKTVLAAVAIQFQKETGHEVKITYGSSGVLTSQIENGAPFQMFLSADESFVQRLASKGLAKDSGVNYAVGRVVLFAPHGSTLRVDPELKDLKAAVADGRIEKFAIPNPEHAPYGRAARAVLERAGLWSAIQPKLALGEDASQAMEFVAIGSSQGGIVPLSLAKAPEIAKLGNVILIPADWHSGEPLKQRMVLLKNAGDIACAFYRYLQRPNARAILVSYGFEVLGE